MMKTTVAVAGVFAVLLYSQSAAGAPTSSDAKNSGKSAATPAEKNYIGSKDAKFSKQDARLKQAEDLVKQEKFEPAIAICKDVKKELENEAGWKAGQRLKEVSARLKALQLQLGNRKLSAAEKAIRESRYNDAITLANDAAQACAELLEAANRIKGNAVTQQKADAVRVSISPDKVLPELKNNEKMIANYLAEAKVLLKHRRYEDARRRVEEVFKLNPFNQEAAYIISQIYSEYYTAGYHRSIADMRAMLAVEEWSWVEPVFYQKASGEADNPSSSVRIAGDQAIQQKLDKIILPEVQVPGQSVVAALLAVRRLSQEHDPDNRDDLSDEERDKLGVIIDFSVPGTVETAVEKPAAGQNNEDGEENPAPAAAETAAQPAVDINDIEVNFNVKNASLRDVLDYISFLTDLPYHVTPTRVVFGTRSADIRKHVFEVSADAVARITGDTGNVQEAQPAETAPSEDEEGNVEASTLATRQQSEVTINSEDLKTFFKEFGITFDVEGSAINYANGKLTMFNTPENIQRMSDTLAKLNTTKQLIQIELKSIELSEEDCEDLGFEWSLTPTSINHNKTTVGQGEYAALGGPVHFLGNALGRTGSLVSGLNLFPDLLGSWKPFGIDETLNISLTIQALDQNERSETISAPQVTVADGQQATVRLNTTYFFPDSWEDLEVDFETSDGDTIRTVTPPMPEFGDETKIGTTLTVKPTIRNNKVINLHLEPTIAAWVGKDTETIEAVFGDRANENSEWVYHTENYEIWKPQIATRNFVVDVNVYDGETLVIGGLASSELETRLDKIPVLGDLPLIGRLFQRQSEKSKRSNMLFFVTARLLNEGGSQVNRVQNSGGIPDVNR